MIDELNSLAIIMSDQDNLAVAKKDIPKGQKLKYNDDYIEILDAIPQGHRFSLCRINKGEPLKQYGHQFAFSKGVKQGQLISRNNIYAYVPKIKACSKKKKTLTVLKMGTGSKSFKGYVRANNKIGTRNYYLLLPVSLCAADLAGKLAADFDSNELLTGKYGNIDGVVAAEHTEGCGSSDGDIIDRLLLVIRNTLKHPNVGGALLIGLGCEKTNLSVVKEYLGEVSSYAKPIDYLSIQEAGGTGKALEKGKRIIERRLPQIDSVRRENVPLSKLIVGTECGASDSFSGITANPLIGTCVDKIIAAGGSAILSETTEMSGAEQILIDRMVSAAVAKKFLGGVAYYRTLSEKLGVSFDGNLVFGNEKGGLLNLTLKSLGAIQKGGTGPIVDFLDYAEEIEAPGLSIMNGPGNDLESMTGIVASGANIILFSTGAGTTEGNLLVPVVKIATNTEMFNKMPEDMDFDAGRLLGEKETMDGLSEELLCLTNKVASGQKTWAEKWKKRSFQIWTAGKLSL
jgi:altronate hydrolase